MKPIIKATSFDFRSGLLLSREILEQMTIQSRLFRIQYDSYPDGIISGFAFTEQENTLFLTAGMLKHQGNYYCSEQKINVTEILNQADSRFPETGVQYAVLAFTPLEGVQEPEGILTSCMHLTLLGREEFQPDSSVLLAEFQYHQGKREWHTDTRSACEQLRNQLDIKDYYYSFLNESYSLPGETVFSPVIFRMMKDCLSEKNHLTESDYALLFTLSQHECISFEVLRQWFASHQISADMHDRKDIIRQFLSYIQPAEPEFIPQPSQPSEIGQWNC